jgi:hypothetical protein
MGMADSCHGPGPRLEPLEQRVLLSATGFLQGVAFVDANHNGQLDAGDSPKAGATIELYKDGWQQPRTTPTDDNGAYLFSDLDPGTYRLVEIPAPGSGYVNEEVQILSQLNPASRVNSSTIQVTLLDPSDVTVTFDSNAFFARNRLEYLEFTLFGNPKGNSVGQFPIAVAAPGVSSQFLSLCSDLFNDLNLGINVFPVLPTPQPPGPGMPDNAGRVGYLYNHYGLADLSEADAVGLQLAIWELEYDTTVDFNSGNFGPVVPILSTTQTQLDAAILRANFYAEDSVGKSEPVIFLDATLGGQPVSATGLQGMLAAGSFNFANIPNIVIIKKTNGTNNDSPPVPDVPDGPLVSVGSTVTWTYEVTYPGGEPIGSVVVSDDSGVTVSGPSGDANSNALLDPGEKWVYTATGTAVAGQYSNVGTVTGTTTTSGTPVTDKNPDHYFGVQPGIRLVKLTNGRDNNSPTGPLVAVGSTVTWTYDVTNTGNVALGVTVTDSQAGVTPVYQSGDGNSNGQFDSGETWVYTATGAAVAGQYANTGTATGKDATGTVKTPVTASDVDHYFGVQPGIAIVKLTNDTDNNTPTGPPITVGSTVTWTYDVTNTGNVPLANVSVTDSVAGVNPAPVLSGSFNFGDTNNDNLLETGETWVFTATGTAVLGQYANTGTATGVDATGTVQAPVTASDVDYYFGVPSGGGTPAAIDVEKYVKVVQQPCGGGNTGGCGNDGDCGWQYGGCNPCGSQTYNCGTTDYGVDADTAPGPTAPAGSQVVFTYIVTNPGPVALQDVTLVDDDGTPNDPSDDFAPTAVTTSGGYNVGDLNHNRLLDIGEAWRYTSSTVATVGPHQDVATVTGAPVGGGDTVTDWDAGNYLGTLVAGINLEKYVKVADQSGGCGDQTHDYWKGGCFNDWSGCGSKSGYGSDGGASNYWGQCVQDGWTYYGDSGGSGFGCGGGQSNGPSAPVGSRVTFTYVVTDTGKTPLGSITLRDDNGTPTDSSDDFTPTAVTTSGGYNIGDLNHNGLLDVREVWKYTYTTVVTSAGQHSNTATVTGTPAVLDSTGKVVVLGPNVTDQATAYWTGVAPKPGSLAGFVYIDFNDDGEIDFGEDGIAGAKVTLTGTDDLGGAVRLMTQTDEDGEYSFTGLRPGTYVITETQPSAFLDGQDTLGTAGGVAGNDVFSAIRLAAGVNGLSYNFGERPKADGCVRSGQTATIGFWQNKNGQNLIKALNGGCSSTQLGNWLAETFPNLYGALAGKSNTQVAQFYTNLFTAKTCGGMKLECQVMAAALATYVTNSTLAGVTAQRYGFCVTTYGAGNSTYSIGSAGAAFGVANNTRMTVLSILLATNDRSANGQVGINQSSAFRSLVNAVYTGINEAGDIS